MLSRRTQLGRMMLAMALIGAVGVVIALSLTRGRTLAATEEGGRTVRAEEDVAAPNAELADVAAPITGGADSRTTIEGLVDIPEPRASVPPAAEWTASASGYVVPPPTFPQSAEITITAEMMSGDEAVRIADVKCDRAKAWDFETLPAAMIRFRASSKNEERTASGVSPWIELVDANRKTGIRIDLAEYVISGRVTDRSGRPVAGLEVIAHATPIDVPENHFAIAEGRFMQDFSLDEEVMSVSFTDFGDGSISIDVEPTPSFPSVRTNTPESQTSVEINPEQSRINLQQVLANHTFEVSDEVRRDLFEQMLRSEAEILDTAALDLGGRIVHSRSFESEDIDELFEAEVDAGKRVAVTDALGRYVLRFDGPVYVDIETGRLTTQTEDAEPEYLPQHAQASLDQGTPSTTIDFEVARAASIAGRLELPAGADGTIHVFAKRIGADSTETGEANAETGEFSFPRLTEGDWLFYARAGGKAGQDYSLHRKVTLSGGGVHRIDARMRRSCSLEGVLRRDDGSPVSGATVRATGADNTNLSREGKTDENGRFTIVGMYRCDYDLAPVTKLPAVNPLRVAVRGSGSHTDVGAIELPSARGR